MWRKLAATFRIFLRYNGLYANELHQVQRSIFLVLYIVSSVNSLNSVIIIIIIIFIAVLLLERELRRQTNADLKMANETRVLIHAIVET